MARTGEGTGANRPLRRDPGVGRGRNRRPAARGPTGAGDLGAAEQRPAPLVEPRRGDVSGLRLSHRGIEAEA
jgi:hypothetical protein